MGALLKTPPLARFSWSLADAAFGAAAAAPLAGLLWLMMRAPPGPIARFRDSQIEFFSDIGFAFTPWRIALLSAGAGISEELLFRGVLQSWAAGFAPLWVAVLATNVVFGALHARTIAYALIAGAAGAYFGVLFEATDNLLAPMLAHGFYDAVALEFARRAVARRAVQNGRFGGGAGGA